MKLNKLITFGLILILVCCTDSNKNNRDGNSKDEEAKKSEIIHNNKEKSDKNSQTEKKLTKGVKFISILKDAGFKLEKDTLLRSQFLKSRVFNYLKSKYNNLTPSKDLDYLKKIKVSKSDSSVDFDSSFKYRIIIEKWKFKDSSTAKEYFQYMNSNNNIRFFDKPPQLFFRKAIKIFYMTTPVFAAKEELRNVYEMVKRYKDN